MDFNRSFGTSGLRRYGYGGTGSFVQSDFLPELRGRLAAELYKEMSLNSPVIRAILNVFDSYMRASEFRIHPSEEKNESIRWAKFVSECLFEDLDVSFAEFISQVSSKIQYGYAYFEHLFKLRAGYKDFDPLRSSRFSDYKVGFSSLALRSQTSLWNWHIDEEDTILGMYQVNYYNPEKGGGTPLYVPMSVSTLFRTTAYENNPEGLSMLRGCVLDYLYLKRIQEYQIIGMEHDHVGIPDIQVPKEMLDADAPLEARSSLHEIKEQAKKFRQDAESVIVRPSETDVDGNPTGFKFGLIGSPGSKLYDVEAAKRYHQSNMLRSVLAQFLEFGSSDAGSFAVAKVADSIFANSVRGILQLIQSQINRSIIPSLMQANGVYDARLYPKIKHMGVQRLEISDATQILHALANAGINMEQNPELWRTVLDSTNLPPNSNIENVPDKEQVSGTSFSSDLQ